MKTRRITYTLTAHEYLKHLHPSLKSPLREMIEELLLEPLKGKPLRDEFEGFRSHRFKKYRVIYRYRAEKEVIEVLFAGHRREVYKLFSNYLKGLKNKH
ncbi:MAG: type II toxin-antitoxin system RelE/ParE family toxin [Deltaproteobacteria bacterium]|nr:type II toxin-antitoxin system RelE/ParE family toxin [Deltaproteobacteria bacterium]